MSETMTVNPSTTKYTEYFNAVVSNYGEALLLDGQGSERHHRAAQAVDALMREYALAAELLDRVRGSCHVAIEHAWNSGTDAGLVAEQCIAQYPPLAENLRDFLQILRESSDV